MIALPMVTTLKWIILLFGGAAFVMLLLFWASQRRMIYLPSGEVPDPAEVGLPQAERVTFPTRDGLTLNAWFVPPTRAATGDVVLVLNGNAGNRSYRADIARGFAAQGLATLLTDYRGYGGNPGSPSEEGIVLDAMAAREYLAGRPDVNADRLVYFGESLGAAVAVRLALEHRPRALVLRSPFTSLVDVARYHFPYLPVRLLLRDRFASIDRIAEVGCPLLVITAEYDSIVPAEQSRRLFAAAREPKQLLVIQGADHNDEALVAGPQVISAVAELARSAGTGTGDRH
jgi:fermentation-respiration switch protein FrsA (DUF1100 family)